MEIRTLGGVQAQGRKVTGYAAVFQSATDLGEFRECIAPGAFARSLTSGVNVRALYDHQSGAILGTTQARTLQLSEDGHGLRFELDLPDTTVGRDVAELVKRGDVSGCSFGFVTRKDAWSSQDGASLRTLHDVDLIEVTLTADPAYKDTSIAIRSKPSGWDSDPDRMARRMWLETCR